MSWGRGVQIRHAKKPTKLLEQQTRLMREAAAPRTAPNAPPAGWYTSDDGVRRYWNGYGWAP